MNNGIGHVSRPTQRKELIIDDEISRLDEI